MSSPIDLDAAASADEPEPVRAARAFLAGGGAPGPLPDAVADALVEALARRGDAERLGALAATGDKAVAKRARRGLHLLRTRGVNAAIPVASAARAAAPTPEAADLPSLMSITLRDGERIVWYLRTDAEKSGVWVYQARMTETDGLVKFEPGLPTRREWREAEQELMAEPTLVVTRIPSSYARWLLDEAWQLALDAGRTPPREFAEVRHELVRAAPPARHPALERVEERTFADAELERVTDLPETLTWIPDETIARRAYQELEQLSVSQIVIDERQRREQSREILRRACADALAGPWRARMVRRLLDTALVIASLPERAAHSARHDRRRDYARDAALCLAASKQFADAALGAEQVVAARRLFEKLIPEEALAQAAPEKPAGGGLIITP